MSETSKSLMAAVKDAVERMRGRSNAETAASETNRDTVVGSSSAPNFAAPRTFVGEGAREEIASGALRSWADAHGRPFADELGFAGNLDRWLTTDNEATAMLEVERWAATKGINMPYFKTLDEQLCFLSGNDAN